MHKLSFHFILTMSLFVFSFYSQSVFAKASDDVSAGNPYVRAVPPGQPNSAAFMKFTNSSDKAHSIINAKSDVAAIVELHTHTHKDGMMQMRRVDKIDIPANGSTTLQPGGLHIMLIKLHGGLKIDQQVKVTLEFADGSSKEVTAPVKKIMMKGMMKMKTMPKH
jgi:periplasmic copper chaperone A